MQTENIVIADKILVDRNVVERNNEPIVEENVEIQRPVRSNKGIPPTRLIEVMAVAIEEEVEPSSYNQAVTCTQKLKWVEAMNEEMNSMLENETWELVELSEGRKAIGSKWTYKIKKDACGKIQRYKARLVAQGFSQKFGTDYDEVFAPVAKQTTFKILLAVAVVKKN